MDQAMGEAVADPDWDGGWAADRARKRRAWLALTPAQRLAWLEDMLDLAHEAGALDGDRARRAAAARRAWEQPPGSSGAGSPGSSGAGSPAG